MALTLTAIAVVGCAQRPPVSASSAPATPALPALPSPLALACLSCHTGPDRQRHATDLSSLSAQAISEALHAWRDGEREGTVMPRLARALSDSEIRQLARELGAAP